MVSVSILYPHLKRVIESEIGGLEIHDGVPCGIQVVGWRFQDEEVLQATETIDKALRA